MKTSRKLFIAVAACGLGILGAASASQAATIDTFSTAVFGALPGTDTTSGASLTSQNGAVTLAYAGANDSSNAPVKLITLGSFTLTSATSAGAAFAPTDTFTLTIDQTLVPGPMTTGMSTGNVVSIGTIAPKGGGTLVLNFVPNPVMILGKTYILLPASISGPTATGIEGAGKGLLQAELLSPQGSVPAPLPASCWGGLGLLGMQFARQIRRKRRMA